MSRFIAYQEVVLQEVQDESPVGQIPMTIKMFMKGDKVRKCAPGDLVDVDGVLITQRSERTISKIDPLIQDTVIQTMKISKVVSSYEDIEINAKSLKKLVQNSKKKENIQKLANSIAPEIFGLPDVKKSLLLQLVGGTNVVLPD